METENTNNHLTVGGITFKTVEEAQAARLEIHQIKYIQSKADFNDIEQIKKLYNKITKNNTFKTLIGLRFVEELRKITLYENSVLQNQKSMSNADQIENNQNISNDANELENSQKEQDDIPDYTNPAKINNVLDVIRRLSKITETPKPESIHPFEFFEPKKAYKLSLGLNIIQLLIIVTLVVLLSMATFYDKEETIDNTSKDTTTIEMSLNKE